MLYCSSVSHPQKLGILILQSYVTISRHDSMLHIMENFPLSSNIYVTFPKYYFFPNSLAYRLNISGLIYS